MISTRTLALALVGAGCILAAGVGGFLAVSLGTDTPAASTARPLATETAGAAAAEPAAAVPEATEEGPAEPVEAAPSPPAASNPAVSRPAPAATVARPSEAAPTPAESARVERPAAPAPTLAAGQEFEMPENLEASTAAVMTAPPQPEFEELTIQADSVIGIRLDQTVSSETARVEDRVTATVVRDVAVDGLTVVPSGSVLEGSVTAVESGGRFRERATLSIRFTTVVLPDESEIRVQTERISRAGEPPTGESTSKIGAGAVVGAILGGVFGGKKGAAIGGAAGAAGGTAAVMRDGPNPVVIAAGTPLTVKVTEPFVVRLPIPR